MDSLQIVGLVALVVYGMCIIYLSVQHVRDRRNAPTELREDLDEIATVVERLARANRADTMRRVRAAAPTGLSDTQTPTPAPTQLPNAGTDRATLKQQLRDRMRGQT